MVVNLLLMNKSVMLVLIQYNYHHHNILYIEVIDIYIELSIIYLQ